ncbi:hypothetical protein MJD09_08060 [bacterium]|nr:hypothetical protein [bacterium]
MQDVNREMPKYLAEIVDKAMKKDARDRYQSMRAVMADLMILRLFSKQETSRRGGEIPPFAGLPLMNAHSDPRSGHLADGQAKHSTDSSCSGSRSVRARTNEFGSRMEKTQTQEIGKKLNRSRVLDGSIGKLSQLLRLIAQLINAFLRLRYL